MTVQFVGKRPNDYVGLKDTYRLTYTLTGSFFGLDDSLNASGIEQRIYAALPLIGLTVRSTPQAVTGDTAIVVRVQPNDIVAGQTVAQLADRADFSSFDVTLGLENLTLGLNIDLTKMEYLGQIGASGLPTGTTPIPSDATAKDETQQQLAADSLFARLTTFIKSTGVAIIVLAGVVAYVYFKDGD